MYELKDHELIFVFTGPNGAGRRTVAQMSGSTLGMKQVISYTTRPPRSAEVDGQDYHFISMEEFVAAESRGEFIEVIELNGNRYGSKEQEVADTLQKFGAVFLVLNRQGAESLKQLYGNRVVRIFIHADRDVILRRELEHGEDPQVIDLNLSGYEDEMTYKDHCEHIFENLDLAHTVFDLTKTLDENYLHRNLLDLD